MINGGWDALQGVFVALVWVETKGLTLEDIDRVLDFDGLSSGNSHLASEDGLVGSGSDEVKRKDRKVMSDKAIETTSM